MPLMPCPESGCGARVSATAIACPSCGCDVQQFLQTWLEQRTVGFPISPVENWDAHFWYYWGCRSTKICPVEPGWIESGDPIISYTYDGGQKRLDVRSPFSGLVVRSQIKVRENVNICYPDSNGTQHNTFVVIRPSRLSVTRDGQPFEALEIFGAFRDLIDAANYAIGGMNLFDFVFDRGFRRFDPNKKFATKHQLQSALNDLNNVRAIWLPDWDFNSREYVFG